MANLCLSRTALMHVLKESSSLQFIRNSKEELCALFGVIGESETELMEIDPSHSHSISCSTLTASCLFIAIAGLIS